MKNWGEKREKRRERRRGNDTQEWRNFLKILDEAWNNFWTCFENSWDKRFFLGRKVKKKGGGKIEGK